MKLHIKEMSGNSGNAFSSSRRLLNAVNFNENKMIVSSGNPERIGREKGGIIVFSEKFSVPENIRKTIDKIAEDNNIKVWTAGKYLAGRYTDKNGILYGEESLSVEIIGVDSDILIETADKLCEAFEQYSVILKDYSDNLILFSEAGEYNMDYTYHLPEDIISLVPPELCGNINGNPVYWFGYRFRETTSPEQRKNFIDYITGDGDEKISDGHLRQFIERPLGELDKMINIYTLECFVSQGMGRSPLIQKMIYSIGGYTAHETLRFAFEKVENIPADAETILVIGDMNKTDSELKKVIEKISRINNHGKIFVYTLIGKDKNYGNE